MRGGDIQHTATNCNTHHNTLQHTPQHTATHAADLGRENATHTPHMHTHSLARLIPPPFCYSLSLSFALSRSLSGHTHILTHTFEIHDTLRSQYTVLTPTNCAGITNWSHTQERLDWIRLEYLHNELESQHTDEVRCD